MKDRLSLLWEDAKPKDYEDWIRLGVVLTPPVGTYITVAILLLRE